MAILSDISFPEMFKDSGVWPMALDVPTHLSNFRCGALAQKLLECSLLRDDAPIAGVIDLDVLRDTIRALKSAFPGHFRHAFAAKANCMPGVLSFIKDAGMACEVANAPEFLAAENAGAAGPNDSATLRALAPVSFAIAS
jgi:hypothetical protein